MKTIRAVARALIVLVAITGCAGEVGPTQTATINIPKPANPSEVWEVELNLGAASVEVGPDGEGIAQGTIEYNVEALKPSITFAGQRVTIGQEFRGVLPPNSRNAWRLQLGRGVLLSLIVNTGASSGDWELGGLSLRRFQWVQGAADAEVMFSQPNPEQLESFTVNGGAASLTLRGLGNAGIRTGNLTAGAGAITLYFDGQLSGDIDFTLDGGVSSIVIYTGGNPVQLISEGALKSIEANGWAQNKDTYSSPEWAAAAGPRVTIHARLAAATLNLIAGR